MSDTALRRIRRSRTLTQADLARLTGVGQQFISALENGRVNPSLDVAIQLAAILGVSVEQLFGSQHKRDEAVA